MMSGYSIGEVLRTVSGEEVTVGPLPKVCGFSDSYTCSLNGKDCLLRWYRGKAPDIGGISFGPGSGLMEPYAFIQPTEEGFGCVYDIDPSSGRFCSLYGLSTSRAAVRDGEGFAVRRNFSNDADGRLRAAVNITSIMKDLSGFGVQLKGFDPRHVIFDLDTGETAVDIVGILCSDDRRTAYGYLHPQVLAGEKPSAFTDAFLSVCIVYHLLIGADPYEGKAVLSDDTLSAEISDGHYIGHPVFVFDPEDDSNRPEKGVHNEEIRAWGSYPDYFRRFFTEILTSERTDAGFRDILVLLLKLRGGRKICYCGRAMHLDDKAEYGSGYHCPSCGKEHHVFDTGITAMFLRNDMELTPINIDPASDDCKQICASVRQNPKDPNVYGLKNMTDKTWTYGYGGDTVKTAEPGKTVRFAKGLKIDFGTGFVGRLI